MNSILIKKSTIANTAFVTLVLGVIIASTFETLNYHVLYHRFFPVASGVLLFFMVSIIPGERNQVSQLFNLFLIYLLINIVFTSSLAIFTTVASLIPFCILNSKISYKTWDILLKLFEVFTVIAIFSLIFQLVAMPAWKSFMEEIYPADQLTYIFYRAEIEKYGSGMFYDPAILAGVIVFGFCAYIGTHKLQTLKEYVIPIAFLLFIFLTGKRGHFFSLIAAIFIFAIININRFVSRKVLRNFFLNILVVVAFLSFVSVFVQVEIDFSSFRISVMQSKEISALGDLNGRALFWVKALRCFFDHPVMGIGWKNFASLAGEGNHAHNIYLQLLAETGSFGFILFIIAAITALIKTIKLQKKGYGTTYLRGAMIYQFFFLIYGMSGNPLFDSFYFIPYIVSVGIVVTEIRYNRRQEKYGEKYRSLHL